MHLPDTGTEVPKKHPNLQMPLNLLIPGQHSGAIDQRSATQGRLLMVRGHWESGLEAVGAPAPGSSGDSLQDNLKPYYSLLCLLILVESCVELQQLTHTRHRI